ncbi:MAG: class I SAM-dependent methyltransferase [Caldilineaceae bacterium]|nr:class I SAM-dependent methyltransferase [Caldilineaceae bacterium]
MKEQAIQEQLSSALWRIYRRPHQPQPWLQGGNLPWNDPAFSARMLREHLDQAHGAASRVDEERRLQLAWLQEKLALQPGMQICDLTCGPGLYAVELAKQGCTVLGVDFGPAAVAYARELAQQNAVSDRCTILEQDVRTIALPDATFDAILFLYGQLAVFPQHETVALLAKAAAALKPGGRLVVELLNQERVDKTSSNWWFTDNTGLWGDGPFLHLGERFWDDKAELSYERFHILHLESGAYHEVHLCDQTYAVATMQALMHQAGFRHVAVYPRWDGLPLYDNDEWIVYIAQR